MHASLAITTDHQYLCNATNKTSVARHNTYLEQIHWVHHRMFLESDHQFQYSLTRRQSISTPQTYRNPCESTREHVPAEAIVGREGFVAVERDIRLAWIAHRGTRRTKMATESHRERAGATHNRQHRTMASKPKHQFS